MMDPQRDVELGQGGQVRAEEPLLQVDHQAHGVGQGHADQTAGFSWLTALGFGFLTFNSGMAIYRSNGDSASQVFVAGSYADLVLLFWCLRLFAPGARDSPTRNHVKAAVWSLSTLLTALFSYKVAATMPTPVAIIAMAMAGATVAGGFYAFFVRQGQGQRQREPQRAVIDQPTAATVL